ncbi:MAG: hydrogenase maturation protease [Thermovirgaceae bacterium]
MTAVRVLVLGYGNPSRQDDGAGHVLSRLVVSTVRKCGDQAVLWRGHQLVPEAVLEAEDADVAIFCDASLITHEKGYALERVDPFSSGGDGLNMHTFGPGSILALAEKILGRVPEGWLLSVSGASFDFSDRLTPECRKRVRSAHRGFVSFWTDYLNRARPRNRG